VSDPLRRTFRINREPVSEPEKCPGGAGSIESGPNLDAVRTVDVEGPVAADGPGAENTG
jgi:hypothetical protein